MRLIIRQHQQDRIVWYVPERRRTITERDRARADSVATHNPLVEIGYYDLVLVANNGQEIDATIEIK